MVLPVIFAGRSVTSLPCVLCRRGIRFSFNFKVSLKPMARNGRKRRRETSLATTGRGFITGDLTLARSKPIPPPTSPERGARGAFAERTRQMLSVEIPRPRCRMQPTGGTLTHLKPPQEHDATPPDRVRGALHSGIPSHSSACVFLYPCLTLLRNSLI